MTLIIALGLALLLLLLAVMLRARWLHARDEAQRRRVWVALEALCEADPPRYDPAMVAGLCEVARRYFSRAIAAGTPLHRVVQLEMEGSFVMNGRAVPMRAREILAPPACGFVWQAEIGTGLMGFAGSDGHYAPAGAAVESWTKFWLHGLLPLARIGGSDDHARAAATRTMLESCWVPAALLPQFGAQWTQTGPDTALIRFDAVHGIEPMAITLAPDGSLVEVQALRWSDANAEKRYRLQNFGGRMLETGEFSGFSIPTRVELGNHYGGADYAPFFYGTITRVEYRPKESAG